jgi:hypothetical protein
LKSAGECPGTRVWRVAGLALALILFAAPGFVFAQDDRTDEPPEGDQAGGGSSASTNANTTTTKPAATGYFVEPDLFASSIQFAVENFGDNRRPGEGLYLEMSNMITGSGFVSVGPGYRHYMFNQRAFLDTSAAVSWRFYKMGQARFEFTDLAHNQLSVGVQGMWQDQTQVDYYGLGSASSEFDQSQYGMQSTDVVGYATWRPMSNFAVAGEVGLLLPISVVPGGTFKPDLPTVFEAFPQDPGVPIAPQPNFLHTELSATKDTRDYRGHPTDGGLYRAAVTSYFDQGAASTFSFSEYELEGLHLFRLNGPEWLLVLHGWGLVSDVPNGHQIPFYLMPSVGGNNTIRSFPDYRFHDQNLVVVNAESRWALSQHIDGAVFVDAGNVAQAAWDLNLEKRAYGAGVRLHTDHTTFARVDVSTGNEGWKFVFRTTDPFRLSRITRRVAAIPFVP